MFTTRKGLYNPIGTYETDEFSNLLASPYRQEIAEKLFVHDPESIRRRSLSLLELLAYKQLRGI